MHNIQITLYAMLITVSVWWKFKEDNSMKKQKLFNKAVKAIDRYNHSWDLGIRKKQTWRRLLESYFPNLCFDLEHIYKNYCFKRMNKLQAVIDKNGWGDEFEYFLFYL